MANKLLTIDQITNEALRLLVNNMVMGNLVDRRYSDEFAKNGGKIGKTLRIRKPARFTATKGRVINAGDIQDFVEDYVDLTVDSSFVAIEFSTEEQKYSLDMYSDRVLAPAVNALINDIDVQILGLANKVYATVGSEDSGLNEAGTILDAGVILDEAGAPRDDNRSFVVSPAAQAALVNSLKGLFQSADLIGKQYAQGAMGKAFGFTFYMTQNVAKHTNGTALSETITVNGANQSGNTLTIDGLTLNLNVGDVFNIDSVHSVNGVSGISTGRLQDFKVVSVNGAKTGLVITPSLIVDGPSKTVDALPANGAAITFKGANGVTSDLNLAFHKSAIALAIIDKGEPDRPGAKYYTARSKEYNCSISVIQQYDIKTESTITKLLLDYAYELVRPELAVTAVSKVGATR